MGTQGGEVGLEKHTFIKEKKKIIIIIFQLMDYFYLSGTISVEHFNKFWQFWDSIEWHRQTEVPYFSYSAIPEIIELRVCNRQTDRQIDIQICECVDFFFQFNLLPLFSLCWQGYKLLGILGFIKLSHEIKLLTVHFPCPVVHGGIDYRIL